MATSTPTRGVTYDPSAQAPSQAFGNPGPLERGLRSALTGAAADAAAREYYEASAAGDAARAQAAGLRHQNYSQQAQAEAPRVQSIGQVNGVGDAVQYGLGMLGSAPVSIVEPAAGGALGALAATAVGSRFGLRPQFAGRMAQGGGAVGAVAPMYGQFRDAAASEHYQYGLQTGQQQDPNAVLSTIQERGLAQAAPYLLSPIAAAPGRVAAGRTVLPRTTTALGSAAQGLGVSAATDTASTLIGQRYRDQMDPNRDRSGDLTEIADEVIGGAVISAPFEAAGYAGDRLHGTAGAAGNLALRGGRAALQGGEAAADALGAKIKTAWDNRPESLDEAAKIVGATAGEIRNRGEDVATAAAAKVFTKDADIDALLKSQSGMSAEDMMKDDTAKHDAAANFIGKLADGVHQAPDYVQQAAREYSDGQRAPDSWKGLHDAVNNWQRNTHLNKDMQTMFGEGWQKGMAKVGEAAGKVQNAADAARDAYDVMRGERYNAQAPSQVELNALIKDKRDDFSTVLERAITPQLKGFKGTIGLDVASQNVAHALRIWATNGFKMPGEGMAEVPSRMASWFKDPVATVGNAIDLMERQGVIKPMNPKSKERMLSVLGAKSEARKSATDIVAQNLVPTLQDTMKMPQVAGVVNELIRQIESGKVDAAYMAEHFGPQAKLVEDALAEKQHLLKETEREGESGRTEASREVEETMGEKAGGNEDITGMTDAMAPNEGAHADTHHFYNPHNEMPYERGGVILDKKNIDPETGEIIPTPKGFHDDRAENKIAEIKAKNSRAVVEKVPYLDYLVGRHGDDIDSIIKAYQHVADRAGKHLSNEELNSKYYVLREREARGGEATDVDPASLRVVNHGERGNVWAEPVARNRDGDRIGGTSAQGKIWLRTKDGREFATSATKIIKHIADATKREQGTAGNSEMQGLAGQVGMLHHGLASLFATGELEPVVGFRKTEGGQVKWGSAKAKIPDDLRMYSSGKVGKRYGEARAEAERIAANRKVSDHDPEQSNGTMNRGQRMRKASSDAELRNEILRLKEGRLPNYALAREIAALSTNSPLWDAAFSPKRGSEHVVAVAAKEGSKDVVRRNAVRESAIGKLQKIAAEAASKHEESEGSNGLRARATRVDGKAAEELPNRDKVREQAAAVESEIQKMGDTGGPRSLQEDGKGVRTNEAHTGEEIGSRGSVPKPDAEAAAQRMAQTQWAVNALRKGIPSFMEQMKKLDKDRRAKVIEKLKAIAAIGADDSGMDRAQVTRPLTDHPELRGVEIKDPLKLQDYARKVLMNFGEIEPASKGEIKPNPVRFNADGTVKADKADKADKAATPEAPKNILETTIKRHQDYLDNPPDDYTPAEAQKRMQWAEKQIERVQAEQAKLKGSEDYDHLDQLSDYKSALKHIVAKAKEMIDADEHLEQKLGPQGGESRANTRSPKSNVLTFPDGKKSARQLAIEDLERENRAGLERTAADARKEYEAAQRINVGRIAEYVEQASSMPEDVFDEYVRANMTPIERRAFDKVRNAAQSLMEAESALSDYTGDGANPETLNIWHGSNENSWLSNLASREFRFNDRQYASVEHAYQSNKSGKFDQETYDKYKFGGRKVDERKFPGTKGTKTKDGWNLQLMKRLVKDSFEQSPDDAEKLLATGDATLTHTQAKGVWATEFPRILTEVRSELAKSSQSDGAKYNAQSAQAPTGPDPLTDAERVKFFTDINRRLGPKIKSVLTDKLFGKDAKGNEFPISGQFLDDMISASIYATNVLQIGAHESMHALFKRLTDPGANAHRVTDLLLRAANSAPVVRQLERLLDGETNALKQIQAGSKDYAEERLAYMFQFHQAGLLKIGPETQTVFQKIGNVLRKVFGVLSDDQKAEQLLKAFDQGKMPDADAAARVLANHIEANERMYKRVNEALKPLIDKLSRLVNTAETNLQRAGAPEYAEIRRLFKRSVGEDGEQGFLDAKDHKMKMYMSKVASIFEGLEPKDLELAAKYLHSGKPAADPIAKAIVEKVKGELLPELEKYMRDAGVKRMRFDEAANEGKGGWVWEDFGHVKDYFPRAFDTARLVESPDEFVADLVKYNGKELQAMVDDYNAVAQKSGAKGNERSAEDVAKAIHTRMVNGFGQKDLGETSSQVGMSPFMQAVNQRDMHWLSPELLEKYGDKDVTKVLTGYVAQAVKRAEYSRRFGYDGGVLRDLTDKGYYSNVGRMVAEKFGVKDVIAKAEKLVPSKLKPNMDTLMKVIESEVPKADRKDLDAIEMKALKTADGVAKDIMAMEGTLGYDIGPGMRKFQNSMLVYQNMRLLSTSLFSQMIDPMGMVVRGAEMKDAWNAYKRGIKEVVASIKGEHIKDKDAMIANQVGTTDAGGALAAFGQLYSSQYMSGMFRKANEVMFRFNGMEGFNRGMQVAGTRAAINFIKRHALNPGEHSEAFLKELNLTAKDVKVDKEGELNYADPKIQDAIHQWVNGSVMRPNSAQRPAWGSDPHYMIFWHMKQFAYTFHDVIMKRAVHQYKKFGDMGPAGVLAMTYAPIMIATDAMKSVLLTGEEPGWMRAGLGAELEHGVMRAGLAGKFQPVADVALNPHRSVLGLGGPLVEQITQLASQSPKDMVMNASPGANLLNMWMGNSHIEVQGED